MNAPATISAFQMGFNLLVSAGTVHKDDAVFGTSLELTENWDQLLNVALFHGFGGLVCEKVLASHRDTIPTPILRRISESRREAVALDLLLRCELMRLLARLDQENIPVLPLKGPVLGQTLYSDSSLRPACDLDILVHSQDVSRVIGILESRGFTMAPYLARLPILKLLRLKSEIVFSNHRGLIVDLHWGITPSDYPFQIDPAVLWDSARPGEFEGRKVLVLPPEMLLAFLCVHGTKHAWSRLIWLADIARLAEADLDWEEAFLVATRMGCQVPLLLGTLLAHEVLNAAVPSNYIDRARAQREIVSQAERVKVQLSIASPAEPSSLELTIFNARLARRWWDKARHFGAMLKAPTDAELEWLSLPTKFFLLYYPLRIYRIAAKHAPRLIRRR